VPSATIRSSSAARLGHRQRIISVERKQPGDYLGVRHRLAPLSFFESGSDLGFLPVLQIEVLVERLVDQKAAVTPAGLGQPVEPVAAILFGAEDKASPCSLRCSVLRRMQCNTTHCVRQSASHRLWAKSRQSFHSRRAITHYWKKPRRCGGIDSGNVLRVHADRFV